MKILKLIYLIENQNI
ncbi:hypothetical protein CJF30_00002410 [Rutstroemia sp. NJR-2017a BBW]|nr:hypothetical protein CJF30_00002410 [Rutstroemia sp. NJR-2017a BBW]